MEARDRLGGEGLRLIRRYTGVSMERRALSSRGLTAVAAATATVAALAAVLVFTWPSGNSSLVRASVAEVTATTSGGTPWCLEGHQLCIIEPEPGRFIALDTLTTHTYFRGQGCRVQWRTDIELREALNAVSEPGLFREPCGGATFNNTGARVFGPALESLNRFAIERAGDELVIDTGQPCNPASSDRCR
jgi:hypothetical protein